MVVVEQQLRGCWRGGGCGGLEHKRPLLLGKLMAWERPPRLTVGRHHMMPQRGAGV